MHIEHVNLTELSDTPWFDQPHHLHREIQTLDGLNRICQLRSDYSHKVLPRLKEYILGGRWYTDGGTTMRFEAKVYGNKGLPTQVHNLLDKLKFANTVHTPEEFHGHFSHFYERERNWDWQRSLGGLNAMPKGDIPCVHCGTKWTIETSHECRTYDRGHLNEIECPADNNTVGKKLAEVREMVTRNALGNAKLVMYKTTVLRSDRFIDTTLIQNQYSKEMQERNPRGYATADKSYADRAVMVDWNQYVVQEGDVLIFSMQQYIHPACAVERVTAETRAKMANAIEKAGIKIHGSIRIPNGYTDALYSGEWFLFETSRGMFRVGWRRRVISVLAVQYGDMSYETSTFVKVPGSQDHHFDTYGDMTEYLKTL